MTGYEYPQEAVFVATTIAGIVLPWVVQALKRAFGASGRSVVWMAFFVSVVAAVIAAAVTGDVFSPIAASDPVAVVQEVTARGLWVLGLATLVYKTLRGRFGL